MHRRTFLATLGATAAAGCTAQTTPTEEEPTTAPPTTAPTTAPPTTAEPVERPTPEPESTPTRGEVLADRGRVHLRAAIEAYLETAEGEEPTILDVTAASAEFSRFDLDESYRAAREDLTDALEYAEGEVADEANALLQVAEFLNLLGLAQIQLVNAYDRVTVTMRSFYTESYDKINDDVGELDHHRSLASEHAASIDGSFDASIFEVVDAISGEDFEAKVAQMERELATFDDLVDNLDGLDVPMEAFEDDVDSYRTRQYEGVTFDSGDFEATRDGVAAIEPAASLRSLVEELACVFEALAGGTDVMQKAVLARRNGDVDAARSYETEARAEFESCEKLVDEVRPVEDLVDSL